MKTLEEAIDYEGPSDPLTSVKSQIEHFHINEEEEEEEEEFKAFQT